AQGAAKQRVIVRNDQLILQCFSQSGSFPRIYWRRAQGRIVSHGTRSNLCSPPPSLSASLSPNDENCPGDSRLQCKKPLINPRFRKPASSRVEEGAWSRRTRVLTTTASGGAGSVGPIELRFLVNSGGVVGKNKTRGMIMRTAGGRLARG